MAESGQNAISTRLWKLPGQLLLALINTTAIFVIIAASLVLVATARIHQFAENAATTMTEAVLSKIDLPPKEVLANLQNLTAEVRSVGNSLREIKAGELPALQSRIAQLQESLSTVKVSLDRLGSARSAILSDETFGQLGRTITDALIRIRDCSSIPRQTAFQRNLRDKMVESSEVGRPSAPSSK
jgi:hypothetical protein